MKSGRPSIDSEVPPRWRAVNRALLRGAYLGARAWWAFSNPSHVGAVVALWREGQVLLAHSTYRRRWVLPGGGVAHGEDPAAAARRELAEELGLTIGKLHPALVYLDDYERRRDTVHIYEAVLPPGAAPRPDLVEIDAVALLSIDEALDRDPPPHARAYLLSRRVAQRVASPA